MKDVSKKGKIIRKQQSQMFGDIFPYLKKLNESVVIVLRDGVTTMLSDGIIPIAIDFIILQIHLCAWFQAAMKVTPNG